MLGNPTVSYRGDLVAKWCAAFAPHRRIAARQNKDEAKNLLPPRPTQESDFKRTIRWTRLSERIGRTPLLGFIHFEKIYGKPKPETLLSFVLTANASKMLLAPYCGASDATGGAMTDDVSISSLNSAVRFRSFGEIGATSWFAQFGRRRPLWADGSAITQPSGL
jgi:hypothetical protein